MGHEGILISKEWMKIYWSHSIQTHSNIDRKLLIRLRRVVQSMFYASSQYSTSTQATGLPQSQEPLMLLYQDRLLSHIEAEFSLKSYSDFYPQLFHEFFEKVFLVLNEDFFSKKNSWNPTIVKQLMQFQKQFYPNVWAMREA